MRILMYGSEHAAPATRVCDWAVSDGHEVLWAGYLGPVNAHSSAQHVRIQSNNNPAPELARIIEDFKPDIAHAHNCSFLGAVHLKHNFGPIIFSAFGALNPLVDGREDLNPMVEHIMEANPPFIVESQLLYDAAKARFPDLPCELIPLGVNPHHYCKVSADQRTDWRETLDIPSDAVVFFSVRGIGDGYNQDMIVNAFAKALPDLPESSVLAFIKLTRSWDRQEMEDALLEQARRLGIGNKIVWLPQVRHEMMPGMFGISDFVINYPRNDAFPSSILEACACEVPVITAQLPAYTGSYIEEYCRLVTPENPDALADALIAAANEPEAIRLTITREARQHVITHYDEKDMRHKMLALYEKTANRAGH